MRLALIKDGKVDNIVEVDERIGVQWQPPDDVIAVPAPTDLPVDIGHEYDGKNFHIPKPPREEMLRHTRLRYNDDAWFAVPEFGGLIFEATDYETLARFAERAKANPLFTIDWPQEREGRNVKLTAKQIIELNEIITERLIARTRAMTAVIDGINSGAITTHGQVDRPKAPIPAWPKRYNDSLK